MSKVEIIKMVIYREYVRKCIFLEDKRKLIIDDLNRTVCGIVYLINDFSGDNMVLEDIDRTCNSLNVAMEKMDSMLSCEVIRLMQLRFLGKMKCALESEAIYFEILDDADPLRMEMLKPRHVYRYCRIMIIPEEPRDPLQKQLAYVMMAELHMMMHLGMFGRIVVVDPEGKGMNLSMQWNLISSESDWVYMT